jgi:hypothetical protein
MPQYGTIRVYGTIIKEKPGESKDDRLPKYSKENAMENAHIQSGAHFGNHAVFRVHAAGAAGK